jgi:hypothetical protein
MTRAILVGQQGLFKGAREWITYLNRGVLEAGHVLPISLTVFLCKVEFAVPSLTLIASPRQGYSAIVRTIKATADTSFGRSVILPCH